MSSSYGCAEVMQQQVWEGRDHNGRFKCKRQIKRDTEDATSSDVCGLLAYEKSSFLQGEYKCTHAATFNWAVFHSVAFMEIKFS